MKTDPESLACETDARPPHAIQKLRLHPRGGTIYTIY